MVGKTLSWLFAAASLLLALALLGASVSDNGSRSDSQTATLAQVQTEIAKLDPFVAEIRTTVGEAMDHGQLKWEREKHEAAAQRARSQWGQARDRAASLPDTPERRQLLAGLDFVLANMEKMAEETKMAFDLLEARDQPGAIRRMASLDRLYAIVNAELARASELVSGLRLEARGSSASPWRPLMAFSLALAIAAMLLAGGWTHRLLQLRANRYERFFSTPLDMLCIVGSDGFFKRINPAFCEILGHSERDLLAQPYIHLIHPDDRDAAVAAAARVAAGDGLVNLENRCRCKDGSYKWISWRSRYDRDSNLIFSSARDTTEHKKNLQMIEYQRQSLKRAEEVGGIGHWRLNLATGQMSWSDEVYRINDVAPDSFELTSENVLRCYHADDRDTVQRHVRMASESQESFEFQARVVRPNGLERNVLVKGDCERNERGEVEAVFGVIQDITQKFDSERHARRNNTLLSAIAHAQASYIDGRPASEIFDSALHNLLSLTESELGFLCEVIHDGHGEPKLERHAAVGFAPGPSAPRPTNGENSLAASIERELTDIALRTGKLAIINDSANDSRYGGLLSRHPELETFMGLPIKIGSRVLGVVGLANHASGYREADAYMLVPLLRTIGGLLQGYRNKNRRERAEEALKESQERYDLAVKGSSAGVWDWNVKTDELYWSPKYREIVGVDDPSFAPSQEAFVSRIHPEDREGVINALDNHLRARAEYSVEFRFIRDDESEVWLHLRGQAIWDEEDRPTRIAGSITDISQRKGAERTLFCAKERADAANRAKSEFLANMSHEIRTPLNAILGTAQLLYESGLNEAQKDYCRVLHKAGVDLLQLIDEILDLSRVESGRLALRVAVFDFYAMVGDVINLYSPQAHEKGLSLVVRYGEDLPRHVEGDPVRLKQVLSNLIGNAVKYTDEGYALLDFSVHERRGDTCLFRVSVTDTGMGIPADKKELIFEKFAQADSSAARRHDGVGLGLAICKRLTVLMGGDIGVESQPGAGSVFWFTAPLKLASPERAEQPKAPELAGARVLSVADTAISRQMLEEQLTRWEVRHASAAGPRQAVKLLEDAADMGDSFHVALVEFQEPEEDASRLARLIAENPKIKDTRLILLTAKGKRGDAEKFSTLGFAGYLAKPLPPSCVMAALLTVWRQRQAGLADVPLVTRHLLAEQCDVHGVRLETEEAEGPPILLVEDNASNQMIGQHFLQSLGCRVTLAINGKEALDLMERKKFALILMDCQMPLMDGYEATTRIRRLERDGKLQRAPIVALTASAMQGDRERCLAAGMDDYLAKPLKKDALVHVLTRFSVIGDRQTAPQQA